MATTKEKKQKQKENEDKQSLRVSQKQWQWQWQWRAWIAVLCVYAVLTAVAYAVIYMKHVKPLPADASPHLFSEGRALHHLWHLTKRIGIRQEGSPGLLEAANYIKEQLEDMSSRASSKVRVELDESSVNGSFNMIFLGHSLALGYRNHTNILIRISAAQANSDDAAVLVNGHFDSALGSPGAGDCGSCVASMLEVVRLIIDSEWVPPHPVVFLFNGAEEVFFPGSHGFMKTHKWRKTIGAFINIEASGTGGIDLVCQSGPGSWPSKVYATSAVYPMAHSAAQDIFPLIPGDTDFRIFSEDYGSIPGLDIIFLLGGYFYHTAYDKFENIIPGSIQARGENLISLLKAFSDSVNLENSREQAHFLSGGNQTIERRPIFFDFLTLFMVLYPKDIAWIIYFLPLVIMFIGSLFSMNSRSYLSSWTSHISAVLKGILFHVLGLTLAVFVPAICAFLRLTVSKSAMNWYAHPWLALFMFVPGAVMGLLLPNRIWKETQASKKGCMDARRHWASVAYNAAVPFIFIYFGKDAGFMQFSWAIFLIINWPIFKICTKRFGQRSLMSILGYFIPLIIPISFSLYMSGIFLQFLIEKMGMFGSVPEPYGHFVSDIIIACLTGLIVGSCLGPVLPFLETWLSNPVPFKLLIHWCVIAMALSSQFFPYNSAAPKRLVVQHTLETSGNTILGASYSLAVADANPLSFILENAPKAEKELKAVQISSRDSSDICDDNTWMALYPISHLVSKKSKFPALPGEIARHYPTLPFLLRHNETRSTSQIRRVHLELDLGSLQEVWVAALNITGPLGSWSFADQEIPVPEQVNGGPPSYILRLTGSGLENWKFWLEANSSEHLTVGLAVLDQHLDAQTIRLKEAFPSWVDVLACSSFLSSYDF